MRGGELRGEGKLWLGIGLGGLFVSMTIDPLATSSMRSGRDGSVRTKSTFAFPPSFRAKGNVASSPVS